MPSLPVLLQAAASALAQLDALSALAAVARSPGYCRPVVLPPAQAPPQLTIRGGRHPMLDAQLEAGAGPRAGGAGAGATGAVPNDVVLEAAGCRAAIVTGPNMWVCWNGSRGLGGGLTGSRYGVSPHLAYRELILALTYGSPHLLWGGVGWGGPGSASAN